jgi:hypothetical protein
VDGRPTYNRVRPGSPRGSFTTLQSLPSGTLVKEQGPPELILDCGVQRACL